MKPNPILDESYGQLPDGRDVRLFTLTNASGLRAKVTNFGAILVSMEAPDRTGKPADLTLGRDTLAEWLNNSSYLGASVGRYGNRIRGGKFTLNGKSYVLATNNEPAGQPCHLHGGETGFDRVLWDASIIDNQSIEFSYLSPDGEEGYPGNLSVKVTYTLNDRNELIWQARATTDAATPINLIHHSYWNLSGDAATPILDHLLTLHADRYLPTDPGMIPIGEFAPVVGTPMDFTTEHPIGERIDADFEALRLGAGYDHCWVLSENGTNPRLAARVKDPKTGRVMEVLTNQPGVQFYSANFLDDSPGKKQVPLGRRTGLCLETQNFPDAPNQAHFPNSILSPGETYEHLLIHRFSAE
ncbi:MAG: aldose epimerase family protein [Luteolibacter sp.]